ncbi:unnamed protein product [Sympodiomycopsis kandeliae]
MASIIPPKKPRKPGMPKLSIPLRPNSSSGVAGEGFGVIASTSFSTINESTSPAQQQQQHQPQPQQQRQTISNHRPPLRGGTGSLGDIHDESVAYRGPYGRGEEEDDYYEGHLPFQSTASSIYPDTVPGPLTDQQAMTNDLQRAIAGGHNSSSTNISASRRSAAAGNPSKSSSSNNIPTAAMAVPSASNSSPSNLRSAPSSSSSSNNGTSRDPPSLSSLSLHSDKSSSEAKQASSSRHDDSLSTLDENQPHPQSRQPQQQQQHQAEEESEMVLQGNLETLARLGEGASGEVRKCRHKPTGMIMAVKTVAASPNPASHRQILREIAFNRTCHSPFIIRYYGAFLCPENMTIEICMEPGEGGSLDSVYKKVKARNGRTGEKILGKVAESVLKGLDYLHDRRIVHRDIKPSNILFTRNGQIKLCDLGVSGELVNSLAGTFTGTSYYMAPERIKGQPYTITSDVWSLGLTILEVASNRFPFPPEGEPPLGPIDLLSYIITMKTPEIQDDPEAGIKWSRALRDFIERCLEKEGTRRLGPRKMLTHPFIRKSETRQPQPDVAKFVHEVHGWAYPTTTTATSASAVSTPTTVSTVASSSASLSTPTSGTSGTLPSGSKSSNLLLGRIPSVRKAPSPFSAMTPVSATTSAGTGRPSSATSQQSSSTPWTTTTTSTTSSSSPSNPTPTIRLPQPKSSSEQKAKTAPGMVPITRMDTEGRSEEDKLAARVRELDAGICGSPVDDD